VRCPFGEYAAGFFAGDPPGLVGLLVVRKVWDGDPSVGSLDEVLGLDFADEVGAVDVVCGEDSELELLRFVLEVAVVAGVVPHADPEESGVGGQFDEVFVCPESGFDAADLRHQVRFSSALV
jgi:hypothetical protein